LRIAVTCPVHFTSFQIPDSGYIPSQPYISSPPVWPILTLSPLYIDPIIMASSENPNLKASVYFLARSPKYSTIKPYTLRYRPDNGFPQTNVERILHEIEIRDLRKSPKLEYERCGFKMVRMKGGENKMLYEDYDDLEMVEGKHQREVVDSVREALGAKEVVVCDYVVYISFFLFDLILDLQV
jgi:hypothetical protein